MKAICWEGKGTVRVEEVPDPKILNSRDAIVRITSTAICGSDLHLYNGYVPTMERGDILGHEFMGEVVEIGQGVTKLKVGDRVVVPFPIACGNCATCRRDLFSLCENSNPNAWMAEKLWGHSPCRDLRLFPHARRLRRRTGRICPGAVCRRGSHQDSRGSRDEKALFLSDIFPTGYMGAEMCNIQPGDVIAVWGAARWGCSPSPAHGCSAPSG